MNRQDQFHTTVTVDGRDLGAWDKKSGGERSSDSLTYKPGNTRKQVSLGGSVTVGNVTAEVIYDEKIADGVFHWLDERVGAADCVVQQQPLDAAGKAFGRPIVRTGKLDKVTPPDADVDGGGNTVALISIEISCDG